MISKKSVRILGPIVLLASLGVLVAGVAVGKGASSKGAAASTVAACVGASSAIRAPDVAVENAPVSEADLIRAAARQLGTTTISAIRLANPPDAEFTALPGYPGDRWLYIDVRVPDSAACRVEQDWQAARLAGAVRNAAAVAGLPTPFGYTAAAVLPDGTRGDAFSISIGSPIGTEAPLPDQTAEAARIQGAVAAAGLVLRSLAFTGADGAAVIRVEAAGPAPEIVQRWTSLIQQVVGSRSNGAWLVEVDDGTGSAVKVFANSPSTAGAIGWTRPDLRLVDLAATTGG